MHQCISLSDGDILMPPKYLYVALLVSTGSQFTPIKGENENVQNQI